MKFFALDVGDQWVGTAISDEIGMFARPYETVTADTLLDFLRTTFGKEPIGTVIIGHPKTMRGATSDQTKKVEDTKELLATTFPTITFILWDERLSSKRAEGHKKDRTKEEKRRLHSVAAAFILESYLTYKSLFAAQDSQDFSQ